MSKQQSFLVSQLAVDLHCRDMSNPKKFNFCCSPVTVMFSGFYENTVVWPLCCVMYCAALLASLINHIYLTVTSQTNSQFWIKSSCHFSPKPLDVYIMRYHIQDDSIACETAPDAGGFLPWIFCKQTLWFCLYYTVYIMLIGYSEPYLCHNMYMSLRTFSQYEIKC